MRSYIFIIPLTPPSHLNDIRILLQKLCFNTLVSQTHTNWLALVIGQRPTHLPDDNRFISIDFEGKKEEKLQTASEYILNNKIPGDYIIRLDDDDIFNPNILTSISRLEFDIYVDLYQSFISYDTGEIAQRLWYWFPNTCIHKRELAFTQWGEYEPREFKRFRNKPYLIENDHSNIHQFYKKCKVITAPKSHPIYLRVISDISVTAQTLSTKGKSSFLDRFGIWKKNNLIDYQFIVFKTDYIIRQSVAIKILSRIADLTHYLKIKKDRLF